VACGAFAGYLLSRAITERIAVSRLQQYATRIMADGEASSAELRTVLAAVSVSPHRVCSEAEIGYFRALIFESEYLKDAGRMRDGKILCSAGLGRAMQPQEQTEPDFTQQDGTAIYKNYAPYRKSDLTTITLELNNFFVVYTPLTRFHLEPAPMHYSITVMDAPSQKSGPLLSEPLQAKAPIFNTEGNARLGDSLFATRCSIRFFDCVTAYTTIPEMVQANRDKFNGCIALCGLFGGCFGLLCSFLYRRNRSAEQQLRRAISKDKLQLAYQPIVSLASGRIAGAEALARWTDEQGIAVGPEVFVRIAEERGFVGEITRLVVRRALRDFAETLRSHPGFHISVNVAAADLSDPEFLPMLERELYRTGVPAESLAIEITESSTARFEAAVETICQLHRRGHSVHIDDFGTGYSSLSYLHDLSVDAIKIDRSFTHAIGTEAVTVTILPQILAMAEALHLQVIVEGIETSQQAGYFSGGAKSILGQGWLYGHPVPVEELLHRLRTEDEKAALAAAAAA
jgi:sensor c-di-GMP phosphodiesterase-like protein